MSPCVELAFTACDDSFLITAELVLDVMSREVCIRRFELQHRDESIRNSVNCNFASELEELNLLHQKDELDRAYSDEIKCKPKPKRND